MKNNYDFSSIQLYYLEYLFSIEFEIEIGIDAIKTILNKQYLIIEQSKSMLIESIKKDEYLKSIEEEHKGDYINQFYQREEFVIKEIIMHQMYSLCLTIYSFIEGRLKFICEYLEKNNSYKIKIEDLSTNDDLMKFWNYLTKVFEINPALAEKYLTPLKQQKIVRNIIAHQDGKPTIEQLRRITRIKGLEIVNYGNFHQIVINENDYIYFLLDKTELFFKELLKSIDLRHKEIADKK